MSSKVNDNKKLAIQMLIAMIAGIFVGLIFMAVREMVGGDSSTWKTINNIFFQDITAAGGESAVGLINEFQNLLVTGTFSKSRSLAGARLGFGFASEKIIEDLNTIRFSTNPYNVNRMTLAAGVASLKDDSYNKKNAEKIIATRARVKAELEASGFYCLDSRANFIFAKKDGCEGKKLYLGLKEKGVLVRHFDKERIGDFLRITIGTDSEMDIFLEKLKELL